MTARAALSTMSCLAFRMSYTLMSRAGLVSTPGMFRADLTTFSLTSLVTMRALEAPTALRKAATFLVLTSGRVMSSTTSTLPSAALAERTDFSARRFTFLLRV